MTVQELIEALLKFPRTAPVLLDTDTGMPAFAAPAADWCVFSIDGEPACWAQTGDEYATAVVRL